MNLVHIFLEKKSVSLFSGWFRSCTYEGDLFDQKYEHSTTDQGNRQHQLNPSNLINHSFRTSSCQTCHRQSRTWKCDCWHSDPSKDTLSVEKHYSDHELALAWARPACYIVMIHPSSPVLINVILNGFHTDRIPLVIIVIWTLFPWRTFADFQPGTRLVLQLTL